MQKLFVCLAIIFSTYCLSHELSYQERETSSFSLDIFSSQLQSFPSFSSCDEYKHRNTAFYPPKNLQQYTAEQLQHYFYSNNFSEKQILEKELLYLSDEFVKLAKTYAGYNQAVENLYNKFEKYGAFKKVLHTIAGSYSSGLKLQIKRLYQEIQCKKEYQERQKQKSFTEYQELKTIYKYYSPRLAKAVEKRIEVQRYSPNQLQHIMELESVEIINEAKLLSPYSILYLHQGALIDCATAVSDYSKEGFLDKAMCVANFCWTLLDYGEAIAEGVVLGAYSAAHDILTNPIEATVSIVAGKQILAFQLCKVIYNVAEIGATALTNFDGAQEKWNKYTEPLNNIIDAINKKEITVRDAIKGGTAFVVGYKAQGKLLGGLGKFCRTVKHKSLNFVKNNPSLSPQEYLVTPEGLLFKATAQSNKMKLEGKKNNASNLKNIIDNKVSKSEALYAVAASGKGILCKGDLRAKIEQYKEHIFSPEHQRDGILTLGKDKAAIMDSLYDIIVSLDQKGLLKEGANQIKAAINGTNNVEIRCFIQNGEAISVNAYLSRFSRIYGNFIDTTKV